MQAVVTKEVVQRFSLSQESSEEESPPPKKKKANKKVKDKEKEGKQQKHQKRKPRKTFTAEEDEHLLELIGGTGETGFAGGNEWHQYVKDPIFQAHGRMADSLRGH